MRDIELFKFDEYSAQLTLENSAKVASLAAEIAGRQLTGRPVVLVHVAGHADQALKKPANERPSFEMGVSVKRADGAVDVLKQVLGPLPGGAAALANVQFAANGCGSAYRVNSNPTSDAERRRNRRVVIQTRYHDDPIIQLPVPIPPLTRLDQAPPVPDASCASAAGVGRE